MGLSYENLDEITRKIMVEEIEIDLENKTNYISNNLNNMGREIWSELLKKAATAGDDDSLAEETRQKYCFKQKVERRTSKGGVSLVAVPVTAAQTLAEAQFNMYYMRALASRAQSEEKKLIVYRARESANPRAGSEQMIGADLDPAVVLSALRETKGVEPSIGIPLPNSGITVRLF